MENENINLLKTDDLYVGKYLRYATKQYEIQKDNGKKIVSWECVYRTNLADYKSVYGSEVIGLMKGIEGDSDTYILLIENYRFPVDKLILELPSGIIDPEEYGSLESLYRKIKAEENETVKADLQNNYDEMLKQIAIKSGLRELKEETGYIGKFRTFLSLPNYNPIKLFTNVFYDPWKGLENAAFSVFDIDLNEPENKNPIQDLDNCEIIKIHKVKLSKLLEFISDKIEHEGYGVSTHLYFLAIGLQFSNLIKNN
jgi:ADP-ribose pyrophosphatase